MDNERHIPVVPDRDIRRCHLLLFAYIATSSSPMPEDLDEIHALTALWRKYVPAKRAY